MVHLAVAFIGTIVLVILNRHYFKYPSFPTLVLMLWTGAVFGLALDYFLGYRLGMWQYTHHAYYSPGYYIFLIPAWAMVLSCFALIYNLLTRFVPNVSIRLLIYFAIIPIQQEFMGINQDSWVYVASPAIIGVGWIILLESCMVFNFLSLKLNKVVAK
jgi:hypothetical protein